MKKMSRLVIRSIRTLEGPNIHAYQPVIEMLVSLGARDNVPTSKFKSFNENLLRMLPSLREHQCTRGKAGGFVERLTEGTLLGHVIEHIALELQALAGINVVYGKTRCARETGVYSIVVEYQCPHSAHYALRTSVDLVNGLLDQRLIDPTPHVENIERLVAHYDLGPSTRAITEAARYRGIPSLRLNRGSLVQLGYGARQQRIQGTLTQRTSCIAVDIATDKEMTKILLSQHGIPVPPGGLVTSEQAAVEISRSLGGIMVIKPCDSNQGKGVSLRVRCARGVRKAYRIATGYSDRVIVERYVEGRNYRVLVVGGEVVAVSERIPAHVVGDGKNTIAELVRRANQDTRRGRGHEKPLTRLPLDVHALGVLKSQRLGLGDVLKEGQCAYLRWNANLSTGGVAYDVTKSICPENAKVAVQAAELVGLDVAGVDLIAQDISQDVQGTDGAIIEVNAAPGIRMHHYPFRGEPRDVGRSIVNYLFPGHDRGRIPLVAVTGTNGKTTVNRLVAHMGKNWGKVTGSACSDGVYLDAQCLLAADASGPRSARMVLEDSRVEMAVLETARGGILRSGLGFDECDVAVVTNIQDDHVGQDGVEDVDMLRDIKGLVVEVVRPGGTAVLNADDPLVYSLADRTRGKITYFALRHDNPIVEDHVRRGGEAVYCRGNFISMHTGTREIPLLSVASVPCTFGGRYIPNLANVLAALGAGTALGIPPHALVRTLGEFMPDASCNPGRLNLMEVNGYRLCVDYAHNPPAVAALAQFGRQLCSGEGRCIGVVAAPGDRTNAALKRFGQALAYGFDQLFIKEDSDLRGRRPGETAGLIKAGIAAVKPQLPVEVLLEEQVAIERALEQSTREDLIMILYEKYEYTMNALQNLGGKPLSEPASPPLSVAGKASQV